MVNDVMQLSSAHLKLSRNGISFTNPLKYAIEVIHRIIAETISYTI